MEATPRRLAAAVLLLAVSLPGAGQARDVLGRTVGPTLRNPARVVQVAWKKQLVEWQLMVYAPRSLAAPAVDPQSGDVIVGGRDGMVRAFTEDGRELWEKKLPEITCSPAITEERVFVGAADGRLHALDRFTGDPLWDVYVAGELIELPLAAEGTVFVGTDHDSIHALAADKGTVRWVYRREELGSDLSIRGGTGASLGGGRLYAGFSDGAVVALAPKDGRVLWETRLARPARGTFPDADAVPVYRDGVVWAASYGEGVYALDAATGAIRWKHELRGPVSLTLGSQLFVGGAGTAMALDPRTGGTVWSIGLGEAAVGKPVLVRDVVAFPSLKGILFASQRTGKPLQTWDPGSGFTAAPATADGALFALSNLGFLYRLQVVTGTHAR